MRDATLELVDAVVAKGSKVKAAGQDRWVAQCVAHEDRNPSLSIMRGRGQALLFCHGGCSTDAVLDALGWRMEALFDNPKGIDYEYKHQGRVVRTVHRSPAKQFFQSIADDSVIPLYEPPGVDLVAAVAAKRDIYLPEGEKDAETLARHGVTAVASPMGAKNWARCDYSALRGASDLYVVADKDEPGMTRARGLSEHLAGFTSGSVYVVQAATGKDATDHIVAGRTLAEFERVVFDANDDDATPLDPEFENMVEAERGYWRVKKEARRRDDEEEAARVSSKLSPKTLGEILDMQVTHNWVVPGLLERRDRLVMTGAEGAGKSYLMRQITICLAAGLHPFNMRQQVDPVKALVIDAENSEEQWHRATRYVTGRAAALGNDDPRENVVISAGVRMDLSKTPDINEVRRLIDLHNPDVLYIGPLYKLLPRAITNDDDAAPLIETLDGFRENGLVLLMEAHAGKGRGIGGDRDMSPRGSSALLGWPEFGMGLRPVEEDDSMAALVKWRFDREERDWPTHIRRGLDGELPWMPSTTGGY
ncbi:AAA family ATPase [Herbiconiux sp.]|uniref:AAA family ATPase n=1 Tax=Herbiconiux sp. TaxID=1871186 RepID=UPI0025C72A9B|nr:AAA family ATPase [Herbiconiux sp.]